MAGKMVEAEETTGSKLANMQPKRIAGGEVEVYRAKVKENIRIYENNIVTTKKEGFKLDPLGVEKRRAAYFEQLFTTFKSVYDGKEYAAGGKDGAIKVNPNELIGETFSSIMKDFDAAIRKESYIINSKEDKERIFNWDHGTVDKLAAIQGFVKAVNNIFEAAAQNINVNARSSLY